MKFVAVIIKYLSERRQRQLEARRAVNELRDAFMFTQLDIDYFREVA